MRLFLASDDPRLAVWAACESPIEQWLCCGMFAVLGCRAVHGVFRRGRLPELMELANATPACFLFGQHKMGIYRADFLAVVVDPRSNMHRLIAIECDGARYHTSNDQRRNDNRRNGIFVENGYTVVRYTGAVLFRMMRIVLGEIQGLLEAAGVTCEPPTGLEAYARWLLFVTPDPGIQQARKAARQTYDYEQTREERELTFEGEENARFRWADTL